MKKLFEALKDDPACELGLLFGELLAGVLKRTLQILGVIALVKYLRS